MSVYARAVARAERRLCALRGARDIRAAYRLFAQAHALVLRLRP